MKATSVWAQEEQDDEGSPKRIIHVEGERVSGMDTLCGHVDRTSFHWQEGGKVNCKVCLRIWNYVKDRQLP